MTVDFSEHAGVALVVGGTGGLGAPIAAMLAERGARVAVTYRRTPPSGDGPSYRLDLDDLDHLALIADQVLPHV